MSRPIPDYCAYLTGWRVWGLPWPYEPVALTPVGVSEPGWPPKHAQRAICTHFKQGGDLTLSPVNGWVVSTTPTKRLPQSCPSCGHSWHHSPVKDCQCGLWAFKTKADLEASGRTAAVAGEVALWGRIVEHRIGYRAEFAYPLRLWTDAASVARLSVYGVPVAAWDDAHAPQVNPKQAPRDDFYKQFAAVMRQQYSPQQAYQQGYYAHMLRKMFGR